MKPLHLNLVISITALLLFSAQSSAADIEAGKTKSAGCAACHGAEGVSANPEWPNLAGQQAKYIENQLKAFRDGDRENAMMSPMAKPLSDDDIANLAAYYASLVSAGS